MSKPDAPNPPESLRSIFSNALRYWEPRRLIYNAVLGAIVVLHYLDAKTASEVNYGHGDLIWLFLLAVGANVCYCAAHVTDVLLQLSDFRQRWLEWRWALMLLGCVISAALAHIICGPFFRIPLQ